MGCAWLLLFTMHRPWLAVVAGGITVFIISLNVYDFVDAVGSTIDVAYGQGLAYTGIALYIMSFLYFAVPVPVWSRVGGWWTTRTSITTTHPLETS